MNGEEKKQICHSREGGNQDWIPAFAGMTERSCFSLDTLHSSLKKRNPMKKVHLLPPDVISKIAAGEVIDRPASVLKELLENALDAKTKSIEIHLKEAGKTLLQIKDSGIGIDKEDLETIFLRHATSKIKKSDDLFNISSLGFRGEALYSVAAIADIVLKSRTKDQDSGWEIHMRGGEKINFQPVNMPVGTHIEVKELFFNTPARKKFLKSNTSELNQIMNTLIPYTLLHPKCNFVLKHGNRTLVDFTPANNLVERIGQAFHLDKNFLIENEKTLEDKNTTIKMVLGDINIQRPRRDLQYIFVNGRPVQSRLLAFQMNDVYKMIFPPSTYAFFALFIDLPTENIDVNIHPTKREVKIKDESSFIPAIRILCEHALMSQSKPKLVNGQGSFGKCQEPTSHTGHESRATSQGIPAKDILYGPTITANFPKQSSGTQHSPSQTAFVSSNTPEILFDSKPETLKEKFTHAKFVGLFMKKYVLFEIESSLLMVDQHAAQERIMFERFKAQVEKRKVEVQNLLAPVLINVTLQEMLKWEQAQYKLNDTGLETTQWDKETIALHTHPGWMRSPEMIVKTLLGDETIKNWDYDTIARRACRSSVMAGDSMTKEEAEYQRKELLKCQDPFTCPHGRPIVIELTDRFLEKQFLRT